MINTPDTSHHVANGVLTLKTRCPIGFVSCRSDYRVGVPAGVAVTVKKSSGTVDALAVGGRMSDVRDESAPLTVTAR